ncbi:MAG: transposase [Patescibacteria group bacterium]
MPARYSPLVENYYYHVFNRGVNKRPLFKSKYEYRRFLLLLKYYNFVNYPIKFSKFMTLASDQRQEIWNRLDKDKKHTDILSYCLMPNHFHLLLKQNDDNGISKLLANLQNSYARYFNIKNERIGPLFQGQFKAVRIDSEEQLLHVSRYIHLNPYSSGIVKDSNKLINYSWSSLPEYISQSKFPFCKKDDILCNFKSEDLYKNFVLDNADHQKELENIKHLTFD